MRVTNINDVTIYSLSNSEKLAIPSWAASLHRKKLNKVHEWSKRIEVIQDFGFPEVTNRIKITPDQEYIVATGSYKTQMRVFDLSQKAMKFERHTDSETVQMQILSFDWSKVALLQADRYIELHAKYGLHHRVRIPKYGRDMIYDCMNCDLLVGGSGEEIWRLNLESGTFLKSYITTSKDTNVLKISPAHGLLVTGGNSGVCDFFHPDEKRLLASLNVAEDLRNHCEDLSSDPFDITALEFCSNGLSIACGTSSGHILIYDLRSSKPFLIQEHRYRLPIKFIGTHTNNLIFSADSKVVRVWNKDTGNLVTAVEPTADINDVCLIGTSGMFCCAVEKPDIESFYIPSLGTAPKWLSYLENITEEMEEAPSAKIYDDYKFVTREEIERLSLSELIGTNKLLPYMHGFFIDLGLYQKAKAIAMPFAYDEYKKNTIKERLRKKAESRIIPPSNTPLVNAQFAKRILLKHKSQRKESSGASDFKETDQKQDDILKDSRFAKMFVDEEFEIDENTEEWKLHNPSEAHRRTKEKLETSNDIGSSDSSD